jgi:ABC-type multidrug transport system fused ATPase/permease subunit
MNMQDKKYGSAKAFARMYSYVKKYAPLALLYLALSIAGTLISLFFASMMNLSIESAIASRNDDLRRYLLRSALAVAAGILVAFCSAYAYGVFKAKVMRDIRDHAFGHLQRLPLSFIEGHHTGDLISRCTNDLQAVQAFIGEDLFRIAVQFASMIITSAYLVSVNARLLACSLALMPPVLILSTRLTKPMGRYFNEASVHQGKADSVAQDAYGGIYVIKAFTLEGHFFGRFSSHVDAGLGLAIKAIHRLKWLPIFNIILWSSPFTICLIYGAYLAINKEISPGQLPAFVYLLNNIVWPFSALPRTIGNIRSSIGKAERLFEILEEGEERAGGGDFDISESRECIRFSRVSFSYGEAPRRDVLAGLCFDLEKGTKAALVGKSGCGKSTVLKLIAGFYDLGEGSLRFFERDSKDWSLAAIRAKIALVTQDAFLYPSTLLSNILLGRPGATKEEAVKAAVAAHAHEFIAELPEGYDTMVGERGVRLSGGQRQRISLARAFLRDAPVVLLDEPTSALDGISEALVRESMNSLMANKTVLIVTHRLSAIMDVDEILVMDGGRIVERGTHEELMKGGGAYADLYSRQFEKEAAP